MQYVYHGGACCGIRHIFGLGKGPDQSTIALPAGTTGTTGVARAYSNERPQETLGERLKAYVADFDASMKGVLEITLTAGREVSAGCNCNDCQKLLAKANNNTPAGNWEPLLFELGFKVVNEFKNSNSGNYVRIYHRTTGDARPVEQKEAE